MDDSNVRKGRDNLPKLIWSLIAVFLIFILLLVFTYKNPGLLAVDSFVVTSLLFIIVLLMAVERYGKKNTVIFFAITSAVSLFFENLSVATGFPFGLYHYSPTLGRLPVPPIIIFAYFAMGYLSWIVAHVVTGHYHRKLEGRSVFVVPFIATFIMVMWDLTVDPISSTLQGLWVWQSPGAYFGVPLSNFFGWFLVVFIFFQIFALYISRYDRIDQKKTAAFSTKLFWSEAPAMYSIMAMGTILSIFYEYNDITISMALITVFTMIFVAILAFVHIMNNPDLT